MYCYMCIGCFTQCVLFISLFLFILFLFVEIRLDMSLFVTVVAHEIRVISLLAILGLGWCFSCIVSPLLGDQTYSSVSLRVHGFVQMLIVNRMQVAMAKMTKR